MTSSAEAATRLLATALQVDESDIGDSTAIGATERWDSLAHMRLVLSLEEHLGHQLDTEDMLAIEKFGDVVSFLDRQSS